MKQQVTITVKGISFEVSMKQLEVLVLMPGTSVILMELRYDSLFCEWNRSKVSDKLYFFVEDVEKAAVSAHKKAFK